MGVRLLMDKEKLKEDLFEMNMDCLCYGKREFFTEAKAYLMRNMRIKNSALSL